ncbi:hypothetical protein GALL_521130 [mine drainage metagenome]|uniref:Uncharacterized protein n=1 Tax=mine drainage metagenome TaxID=410659 RepID=A0A1J5P6D5_9ZZZZ
MIGGEDKGLSRDDRRESVAAHAQSGKALRKPRIAIEGEKERAGREGAPGNPKPIVHRQKS